MRLHIATHIVGLGMALAVGSGSDAWSQKKRAVTKQTPPQKAAIYQPPSVAPAVVLRLREQALDIGLTALEHDSAATAVKADLMAHYTDYRQQKLPGQRMVLEQGQVGIYTYARDGVVRVKKIDRRKPKQATEIIYEPDAKNGAMIADFSVNRTDSSNVFVEKAIAFYARPTLENGYRKVEDRQTVNLNKSDLVIGRYVYRSDGTYVPTLAYNQLVGDEYISNQISVHGVFETRQKDGSVVQKRDTTQQAARNVVEIVQKVLGETEADKMKPYIPEVYRSVSAP